MTVPTIRLAIDPPLAALPPAPADADIEVFAFGPASGPLLGACLGADEALLSPEERARAAEMGDAGRRAEFTRGRALARAVLGARLGVAPGSLAFELGENGKPGLAGSALAFNWAHTAGWHALAMSRHGPVGVDLERLRAVPRYERIIEKFFTPAERAELWAAAASPSDRVHQFFRLWTAKEALIKAFGGGVFKHVLETEFRAGARSGELEVFRVPAWAGPASAWASRELAIDPAVVANVAWRTG